MIELGSACPDFELPSTRGESKSLKSYEGKKLLLIGFTCNHCPYVQAYEERLNHLTKLFRDRGVAVACINSNDAENYPDDSFEKMKERALEKGFAFDYLRDEDQSVAKAFDAACTPEFYLYNSSRRLVYHGRIDDNMKEPESVKENYLQNAIEDLLAGQPVRKPQTSAIGCSIKWK